MKKFFCTLFGILSLAMYSQNTTTSSGYNAGSETGATYSSYFGYYAGFNNTTDSNSFFGSSSGRNNTTGRFNVFFGTSAGFLNTTGGNNIFIGRESGYSNTIGNANTFIGSMTGRNATGNYNNFFGSHAGHETTGNHNVFIGFNSGRYNTSGWGNVFMGNYSGKNNTTGITNAFIGYNSGAQNTTGGSNVFLGYETGNKNTTGGSNTFLGFRAGFDNSTGLGNTYLGTMSGFKNVTGSYNLYLGHRAGGSSTGGNFNVLAGYYSGDVNSGGSNAFYGANTGRNNTTGTFNTIIGNGAGYTSVVGKHNTFLGANSGYKNIGDNNVFIGSRAGYNELGSDKLYIDNSNTTTPLIYGDFSSKLIGFNGNVGIGTQTATAKLDIFHADLRKVEINPQNQLDVTGNSSIRIKEFVPSIEFHDSSPSSDAAVTFVNNNKFYIGKKTGNALTNSKLFNVDLNTGHTGIGTPTPQGKFEVYSVDENKEIYFRAQHDGRNQNSDSPRLNFVAYGQSAGFGLQAVNSGGYGKKDLVFSAHNASDYTTYYEAARLTHDGKLGIGTNTPSEKLDVNGNVLSNAFRTKSTSINYSHFTRNGVGAAVYINQLDNESSILRLSSGTEQANREVKFTVENDGKTGIGTISPTEMLEVNGRVLSNVFRTKSTNTDYSHLTRNGGGAALYVNQVDNVSPILKLSSGTASPNSQVQFTIENNGNTGIGTATIPVGYKLAVAGKTITEEVKVQLQVNWPDYVFEEKYKLPTLIEVEKHIKEKKHLPNIPSAKEVAKEGGIELGKMNAKLLEKIEELTLYTIHQEKEITELKELKKENKELKERLEKIEALILKK